MLCYVRTTQAGAQVPDLSIENLCGYQCCLLNFSKGLGHPDIEHKKTSQAVQTHPKAQALCWRPGEHCNPGCYCSHFENCLWFQLQTSEQDFQKVAFPGSAGRHSLHGLHLLLYRNGEMSCCSLLGMLCILRRTDTLFPCNWKPSAVSSKHLLNIWEIWYKLSTWTLGLDLPGLISVYWSRTDDSYLSSPVPHFLSLCTLNNTGWTYIKIMVKLKWLYDIGNMRECLLYKNWLSMVFLILLSGTVWILFCF